MIDRILEPEVMDTPEDAREYDSMDHVEANTALVDRLVELGAAGRMLDIGTGPGHIPLLVCERIHGASVTAIDLSKEMLAIAERHRLDSPHASRVQLSLADAKHLDFPDDHFNVVYSNTILHHIPDPRPFLAEAWRVLRPGGCLLIRDLFRPGTEERILELVDLHATGATAYQRELFRASLHAALTQAELGAVAEGLGIEAEVVTDTDRHMSLQRPLNS